MSWLSNNIGEAFKKQISRSQENITGDLNPQEILQQNEELNKKIAEIEKELNEKNERLKILEQNNGDNSNLVNQLNFFKTKLNEAGTLLKNMTIENRQLTEKDEQNKAEIDKLKQENVENKERLQKYIKNNVEMQKKRK